MVKHVHTVATAMDWMVWTEFSLAASLRNTHKIDLTGGKRASLSTRRRGFTCAYLSCDELNFYLNEIAAEICSLPQQVQFSLLLRLHRELPPYVWNQWLK